MLARATASILNVEEASSARESMVREVNRARSTDSHRYTVSPPREDRELLPNFATSEATRQDDDNPHLFRQIPRSASAFCVEACAFVRWVKSTEDVRRELTRNQQY